MKTDPAFRELYERESPTVFRAVFLMCGDRAVAEDATQEAFARALARWRRLGGHTWAGGWVTTTALNVARRSLRRRPAAPTGPLTREVDLDAGMDLRLAIRSLPPRQQEAVVLYYLLDLPVAEVAAAMDCDAGTVKTHLSRARGTLARVLAEPDSHDEPTRSNHG